MPDIFNQIEHKLYRADYQPPHNRQEACLALHSAFCNGIHIPRVYLSDHAATKSLAHKVCKGCLFSDISDIKLTTRFYLQSFHLSYKQINQLDWDLRAEIIALTERVLADGWGSGIVHYEHARFSPVPEDKLLPWLQAQTCSIDEELELIMGILGTRHRSRRDLLLLMEDCFPIEKCRQDPTILSAVFSQQIERHWQQSWLLPQHYIPISPEFALVDMLTFAQDI